MGCIAYIPPWPYIHTNNVDNRKRRPLPAKYCHMYSKVTLSTDAKMETFLRLSVTRFAKKEAQGTGKPKAGWIRRRTVTKWSLTFNLVFPQTCVSMASVLSRWGF